MSQPLPKQLSNRLMKQLSGQLPLEEIARLLDVPESEVKQRLSVSTSHTLSQAGLYRPLPEKPSKPTKATTQVNELPACRLAPGQQLVQMLQQGLEIMASPTCR